MELIHLNVIVLIVINFLKNLEQGQASLLQHFNQVIENLVLGKSILTFLLDTLNFFAVITRVEFV